MSQLSLTEIALGGRRTIDARFQVFHAEHPEVYREFVRLAREARASGLPRVGAKLIAEVIRWNRLTSGKDAEGFRINNVFVSRYARLIMEREPDLEGFFETRELQSA